MSMKAPTLDEFIRIFAGKQVDQDGFPPEQPFQCVDLVDRWSQFLGGPDMAGNARDYIGRSNAAFKWVPKGQAPRKGDIVVWSPPMGGGYGHVGIFVDGNARNFRSFDQNFGGPFAKLVRHTADTVYVAGYMRPHDLKGVTLKADMAAGASAQDWHDTTVQAWIEDITGFEHKLSEIRKNHSKHRSRKDVEQAFMVRNRTEWIKGIKKAYKDLYGRQPTAKELNEKIRGRVYVKRLRAEIAATLARAYKRGAIK